MLSPSRASDGRRDLSSTFSIRSSTSESSSADNTLSTSPRSSHAVSSKKVDVRKRVLRAVISCNSMAENLAHEALALGVIIGELTPVPMLGQGAKLLLALYDGAIDTHINGLQYLDLVGRAADSVSSMGCEMRKAGDVVVKELSEPLGQLENAFNNILNSMERNERLHWYQRYLNRREIQREIMALDKALTDILDDFGRIISLRMFRHVGEVAERLERLAVPQ